MGTVEKMRPRGPTLLTSTLQFGGNVMELSHEGLAVDWLHDQMGVSDSHVD